MNALSCLDQAFAASQAAHPSLEGSTVLQNFLELSEEEWSLEMARSASHHERSGSFGKSKLDRTLQLFKDLTHNTASLVQGKHDEDDEDPEYLKVHLASHFCRQPLPLPSAPQTAIVLSNSVCRLWTLAQEAWLASLRGPCNFCRLA